MLMMSRRQGESILIGGGIEIVITRIGRSRVKVGIRAPRDTPVIARELQLVRDENIAAANVTATADFSNLIAKIHSSSSSAGPLR
jgi:carbon storage regulator